MNGWQIAQLNIARLNAPLDSPQLSGFVEQLEEINALADSAPGFVWRLMSEAGDATTVEQKLRRLIANGPTSAAFTFKQVFAMPGAIAPDGDGQPSFDDVCAAL